VGNGAHLITKGMMMIDDTEKDETYPNVYLLDEFGGEKETAEFCGNYWIIRTWEIQVEGVTKHWFCQSMYSISTEIINKLQRLNPDNQPAVNVSFDTDKQPM
jgi:hypothetical protein